MAACQVLLQLFRSWYYFITNFIFHVISLPVIHQLSASPHFILKVSNPMIADNIGKAAQISKWYMNTPTKLPTTTTDWNYDKSGNNTSTF